MCLAPSLPPPLFFLSRPLFLWMERVLLFVSHLWDPRSRHVNTDLCPVCRFLPRPVPSSADRLASVFDAVAPCENELLQPGVQFRPKVFLIDASVPDWFSTVLFSSAALRLNFVPAPEPGLRPKILLFFTGVSSSCLVPECGLGGVDRLVLVCLGAWLPPRPVLQQCLHGPREVYSISSPTAGALVRLFWWVSAKEGVVSETDLRNLPTVVFRAERALADRKQATNYPFL